MNLEELEKKYEELGREIERLRKESQEPEIEYVFTAFISSLNTEYTGGIKRWALDNGRMHQENVVVLNAEGIENGMESGFARAYRVGDLDIIVGNNGRGGYPLEPDLASVIEAAHDPSPKVQEKHKEIIRNYLANRSTESRTFNVEDVDAAWAKWIESFGFEFMTVDVDDDKYFTNGKTYIVSEREIGAIDNDGEVCCLSSSVIMTLSPKLYKTLKPFLDLSKAL